MAATNTATVAGDLEYGNSVKVLAPVVGTELPEEERDKGFQVRRSEPERQRGTWSPHEALNIISKSEETDLAPRQIAMQPGRTELPGSIVRVEDYSVSCEIYNAEGTSLISLPRTIFPRDIYFGAPIRIKLVDAMGVKRLEVVFRDLDPARLAEGAAEIDALADDF